MTDGKKIMSRIAIKVTSARINGRDYTDVAKKEIEEKRDHLCSDDLFTFLKSFDNDHLLTGVIIKSGILKDEEVMNLLTKMDLSFSLCEIAAEKYHHAEKFITRLIIALYKKSSSSAKKILHSTVRALSEDAKLDIADEVNGDPKIHSILSLS